MKILITGAHGFIGQNLVYRLLNLKAEQNTLTELEIDEIIEFDIDSDPALLTEMARRCDFVFHLAGVNRPEDPNEFMKGNFGFTSELLDALELHGNTCPVMISSSIQATLDNEYGRSKKSGEELMFEYGKRTGAKVLIYRFANVFGKWSRPNYNSAVATFCHNMARGLPIKVNDPNAEVKLVYIDDLVDEMILALLGQENRVEPYCQVPLEYTVNLGTIVELLESFVASRINLSVADQRDEFSKKLYATYISFLPTDCFSYPLKMNVDQRGSFTEFLRTRERGQVSVNIMKPGVTKGNHWHHTKNEKFLVVAGEGIIRFRHLLTNEIVVYTVTEKKLDVVDIPPGYTHNIENTGTSNLVTIMWANEPFDSLHPDTYYLEV